MLHWAVPFFNGHYYILAAIRPHILNRFCLRKIRYSGNLTSGPTVLETSIQQLWTTGDKNSPDTQRYIAP